jgi:hypothetical protein
MELELRVAMSGVRPRKNILAAGPQSQESFLKQTVFLFSVSKLIYYELN